MLPRSARLSISRKSGLPCHLTLHGSPSLPVSADSLIHLTLSLVYKPTSEIR